MSIVLYNGKGNGGGFIADNVENHNTDRTQWSFYHMRDNNWNHCEDSYTAASRYADSILRYIVSEIILDDVHA